MKAVMRKLTISVSEDFYQAPLRTAGARKMGAFIETHLNKIVASENNLAAGYRTMAQDKEREAAVEEWLQLSGKTLKKAEAAFRS